MAGILLLLFAKWLCLDGTVFLSMRNSEEHSDDPMSLSSVNMDLVLMNGYGMAYREISLDESTAFVFRGYDEKGKIIARYDY